MPNRTFTENLFRQIKLNRCRARLLAAERTTSVQTLLLDVP